MGILTRATWFAFGCLGVAVNARSQISPGPLATPHASLEGTRNCLKCHKLGSGPSVEKCLECHTEISSRMKQEKGYHHRAVTVNKQPCFACHSDHAGRDFRLVTWPGGSRDTFDHAGTGWNLDGAHGKKVACRDCHRSDFVIAELHHDNPHVDVATTFLGLDTSCMSCHFDEHRGQVSDDCTTCHSAEAWKPARAFDHSKTAFPLTGKHRPVECARCHAAETDNNRKRDDGAFARYKPVEHANCTACHKDVHAGKLGANCASCHQTSGWNDVENKDFDHSKTRFPLKGLHVQVDCRKCHQGEKKTAGMKFAACSDCHTDIHDGQFAKSAGGGRCESCHDVDGFKLPHFTAVQHAATKFPLKGAHLALRCLACHQERTGKSGKRRIEYRLRSVTCQECHVDPHEAQFKDRRCETCHNVEDFRRVRFDHDRDSTYRLEGEHRRVPCAGCHVKVSANGVSFVRYKPIDPSCTTCHSTSVKRLESN